MADWAQSSFPRDTAIYLLGRVSEALLSRAFADPELVEVYGRWLRRSNDAGFTSSDTLELVETGSASGRARLFARAKGDEFVVVFEGKAFSAVSAAGFDRSANALLGVHIPQFQGDVGAAIRFCRALLSRIERLASATAYPSPWAC